MLLRRGRRGLWWLLLRAAACRACLTDADVLFVLDRSVSIGQDNWNDAILDFLDAQVARLAPSEETDVRVGVVVFPAFDGAQDDLSGGAAVAVNLTHDSGAVAAAIASAVRGGRVHGDGESCANTGADNDGDCECDPRGGGWTAYGGYDLGPSNSSLSWPCGGWRWTPTWHALDVARTTLDDARGANKSTYTHRFKRPVHLTLEAASALKAWIAAHGGGALRGVGVGDKWTDLGSNCDPFCDEQGMGLFVGQGYTGSVNMTYFDDSALYCDEAYDDHPFGCADGALAANCDQLWAIEDLVGENFLAEFGAVLCGTGEFSWDYPTAAPTPAVACGDDAAWFVSGKPSRGCDWVAESPAARCGKTDSDGEAADDACRETADGGAVAAAELGSSACADASAVASADGAAGRSDSLTGARADAEAIDPAKLCSSACADASAVLVPELDAVRCAIPLAESGAVLVSELLAERHALPQRDSVCGAVQLPQRDSVDPSERDAVLVPELDAVCRAIALSERDAVLVPELFAVRRAVRFVASADGDAGRSDSLTGARADAEAIAPAKLCSSACADASAVASADGDAGRSDSITGSFSDAEAVAAAELGSSACADAPAIAGADGDAGRSVRCARSFSDAETITAATRRRPPRRRPWPASTVSCGTRGRPVKDCAWVADWPPRCDVVGEDFCVAHEVCRRACGNTSSPSAAPSLTAAPTSGRPSPRPSRTARPTETAAPTPGPTTGPDAAAVASAQPRADGGAGEPDGGARRRADAGAVGVRGQFVLVQEGRPVEGLRVGRGLRSRAFAGAPAVAPSPAPTASAALLVEPTELYVVTVTLDFDADDVAACGADAVVVGDSDPLTSDVVRDILNLTSPSSTLDLGRAARADVAAVGARRGAAAIADGRARKSDRGSRAEAVSRAHGDARQSDSLTGARADAETVAAAELGSSACADAAAIASTHGDAGQSLRVRSDPEANAASELGSSACADAEALASADGDARKPIGSTCFRADAEANAPAELRSSACADAPAIAGADGDARKPHSITGARSDAEAYAPAELGSSACADAEALASADGDARKPIGSTCFRSDAEAIAAAELGSSSWANTAAIASTHSHARKPVRSARFFSDAKADAASELGSGACANAEALASADVYSRESDSSTCFRSDAEGYAAAELGSSACADASAIASTDGDAGNPSAAPRPPTPTPSSLACANAEALASADAPPTAHLRSDAGYAAAELGSSACADASAIADGAAIGSTCARQHDGEAVRVLAMPFTGDADALIIAILDVDGKDDRKQRESVCVQDDDIAAYVVRGGDRGEVAVVKSNASCDGRTQEPSTTFLSTAPGFLCDNPERFPELGVVTCAGCDQCAENPDLERYFPVDQRSRAVLLAFPRDLSTFVVHVGVLCDDCVFDGGRTFNFAAVVGHTDGLFCAAAAKRAAGDESAGSWVGAWDADSSDDEPGRRRLAGEGAAIEVFARVAGDDVLRLALCANQIFNPTSISLVDLHTGLAGGGAVRSVAALVGDVVAEGLEADYGVDAAALSVAADDVDDRRAGGGGGGGGGGAATRRRAASGPSSPSPSAPRASPAGSREPRRRRDGGAPRRCRRSTPPRSWAGSARSASSTTSWTSAAAAPAARGRRFVDGGGAVLAPRPADDAAVLVEDCLVDLDAGGPLLLAADDADRVGD
ncbi:hypothetical protein JL722_5438 [Aureococcus anophagefferens]|nr:hypothetical protein JL722_5438 [Aureococcus anophagefferens]